MRQTAHLQLRQVCVQHFYGSSLEGAQSIEISGEGHFSSYSVHDNPINNYDHVNISQHYLGDDLKIIDGKYEIEDGLNPLNFERLCMELGWRLVLNAARIFQLDLRIELLICLSKQPFSGKDRRGRILVARGHLTFIHIFWCRMQCMLPALNISNPNLSSFHLNLQPQGNCSIFDFV